MYLVFLTLRIGVVKRLATFVTLLFVSCTLSVCALVLLPLCQRREPRASAVRRLYSSADGLHARLHARPGRLLLLLLPVRYSVSRLRRPVVACILDHV